MRAIAGLAALLGAAVSTPAAAQVVDCDRLRAQLASLSGGDGGYAAAAQKQRAELGRTVAYARSLGCDRRRVFIFGDDPPPQCGGVNARIGAMQANLAALEARAGGGDRARLMARYDAYCRGGAQRVAAPAPQRERGLLESLFGGPSQELEQVPLEELERPDRADDDRLRSGQNVICVRKCDGGFFPLPISRRAGNEALSELCTALCPNVEAEVFTRRSDDLDTAVSLRGDDYSSLANARKFEKTFDPACTCRPPGQSWVEALAKAEEVLGSRRKGDLIVSPEKAQELSLPKDVRQEARRKPRKETAARKPAEPDLTAQEGASGAQAPTAGSESSGIGGAGEASPALGRTQGETRDKPGPDGSTRKVRTVGPTL